MNTDNKVLTASEAAIEFTGPDGGAKTVMARRASAMIHYARKAFKAGAEWQKEQDKEILTLANQLAAAIHIRGDQIPQLLVGYTNEAVFHKLQQTLYNDKTL